MPAAARLLRETWLGLLDLLYPPRCMVCGVFGADCLCADCRSDFRPLGPPLCDRCGAMIAPTPSGLCVECSQSALYFDMARAAGRFDGALRKAILSLKYGGKRTLAQPLGAYLADYLATCPYGNELPDVVVPVPLHSTRLRMRGFNQSSLVAAVVADRLGIAVSYSALRRTRNTRPQVELRAQERMKNVRDAFAVHRDQDVRGKVVLLVDDVLTTMHTADECARVISAAGARRVFVAALARGV